MTAGELGQTTDPTELIPGSVAAVADSMWAIRRLGDSLHEAGTGLQRVDTTEGWSGAAAEKFRNSFDTEPAKWLVAGDCFHHAADALDAYDSTLRWAQLQAAEAIRLWHAGEQATAEATTAHAAAVRAAEREAQEKVANGIPATPRSVPFTDPGEASREHARQLLERARTQLRSAGDTANARVGAARDKAPEKPGFWSRLGSGIADVASDIGDGLENVVVDTVNGVASFGNAVIHHPLDVAGMLGGGALTAVSGFGDFVGGALDATGVGAIVGAPVNAVSTAGVLTGAGMITASATDLARHAGTDDRVSPLQRGTPDSGGGVGRPGTKTDRLKEHLTDRDLEAAQRESRGEVVRRKADGTPWDHVDEVRNAQRGLVNRINGIERQLGDVRISDAEREALRSELGEASKLLDHSEEYLPRG